MRRFWFYGRVCGESEIDSSSEEEVPGEKDMSSFLREMSSVSWLPGTEEEEEEEEVVAEELADGEGREFPTDAPNW